MKPKRTPFYFFILMALGCAGMLSIYIFLWTMTERTHERVATLTNDVALATEREKRADDTGDFIEDIRDDGDLVKSFFISRSNVLVAIETLEGLALTTGATIDITRVENEGQTPTDPGRLLLELRAEGTWVSISQFVALLEHLPFHTNFTYFALNTSPGGEEPAPWTLQARLKAQLVD
ncbi:MAG: hypothetical protein AAB458_02770 [Patescibacteria group bacterium]